MNLWYGYVLSVDMVTLIVSQNVLDAKRNENKMNQSLRIAGNSMIARNNNEKNASCIRVIWEGNAGYSKISKKDFQGMKEDHVAIVIGTSD